MLNAGYIRRTIGTGMPREVAMAKVINISDYLDVGTYERHRRVTPCKVVDFNEKIRTLASRGVRVRRKSKLKRDRLVLPD